MAELNQGDSCYTPHVWSNNIVTGGRVVLGHQYITYSVQPDRDQAQRDQLLRSLRFEEINLRHNDIIDSHNKTFKWVFDSSSNSLFEQWLKSGAGIFWIEGKAGSGKSTLMKYIVNEPRTTQILELWASPQNSLVLKFFFWLSGTPQQRSFKGCLASLLYQILSSHHRSVETICIKRPCCLSYYSLCDWSVQILYEDLLHIVTNIDCSVTLFLDGLDEFDQQDDFNMLMDLIDALSCQQHVKICVSSRPMSTFEVRVTIAQKMILQHLTKKDILQYTQDVTETETRKIKGFHLTDLDVMKLTSMIVLKAEGVFLWVRLVLRSILNGISCRDTIATLIQRLNALPKGMENLYIDMCQRNYEDHQIYQERARKVFAYVARLPMTIFDLVVATDESVQNWYLSNLEPMPNNEIWQKCENLLSTIPKLCFGLLEVVDYGVKPGIPSVLDMPPASCGYRVRMNMRAVQQEFRNKTPKLRKDLTHGAELASDFRYDRLRLCFTHRTVRDFILGTAEGQRCIQNNVVEDADYNRQMGICDIASIIECLKPMVVPNLCRVLGRLNSISPDLVLMHSQKLAEKCSGRPLKFDWTFYSSYRERDLAYSTMAHDVYSYVFWYGSLGCLRTVFESIAKPPSRYYLGWLISTVSGWIPDEHDLLQLYLYLFECGADLFTPQTSFCYVKEMNRICTKTPLWAFVNGVPALLQSKSVSEPELVMKVAFAFINRLLEGPDNGECDIVVYVTDQSYEVLEWIPNFCDRFEAGDICRLLIRTTFKDAKFLAFHSVMYDIKQRFQLGSPFEPQTILEFNALESPDDRRVIAYIAKIDSKLRAFTPSKVQSDVIVRSWRRQHMAKSRLLEPGSQLSPIWKEALKKENEFLANVVEGPWEDSLIDNVSVSNYQVTKDALEAYFHEFSVPGPSMQDLQGSVVDRMPCPKLLLSTIGYFEPEESYVVPLDPSVELTLEDWRLKGTLRECPNMEGYRDTRRALERLLEK